ncbi:MAG: Pr6Pr family membrane protein [Alphaproteobacteria bacterium]|nr:Pr6Pr family membrane protein [Alphaproteobacteria bacterium]
MHGEPVGLARICACILAAVGWFGLVAQLIVSLGLFADQGRTALDAVWAYLGYFTVLTNILVATALTRFAIGGVHRPSNSVMTAVTCYILIVGVTFVTLLQNLYDLNGLHLIADRTMHHVMPALTVLFWFAFVPKGTLRWRYVLGWMVFPLTYVVYAVLRGVVEGFYPYPFIDVSKIGWGQTAINSVGLFAAFLLVGLGAIALDGVLGKRAQAAA